MILWNNLILFQLEGVKYISVTLLLIAWFIRFSLYFTRNLHDKWWTSLQGVIKEPHGLLTLENSRHAQGKQKMVEAPHQWFAGKKRKISVISQRNAISLLRIAISKLIYLINHTIIVWCIYDGLHAEEMLVMCIDFIIKTGIEIPPERLYRGSITLPPCKHCALRTDGFAFALLFTRMQRAAYALIIVRFSKIACERKQFGTEKREMYLVHDHNGAQRDRFWRVALHPPRVENSC